jgi:hypothetical protein
MILDWLYCWTLNLPLIIRSFDIKRFELKDTSSNTTLNKALNSSQEQNQDYQAHEASSSVHGGISGKSGWCFIGQDRGYRSCALVNEDDICMSGDIFPSQELCINPSLRS